MPKIAQGASAIIRFETRRGDGALVDPDNFNAAVQSTWPVTTVKDYLANVLAWKPAGTEGDDPNQTGLYHYGTGQWGQRVVVPTGGTIRDDYRLHVDGSPPNGIGGAAYSGSGAFEVVAAGTVAIPPSGLVDRTFVLKVTAYKEPAHFGYSGGTATADFNALVDEAILAASAIVRAYCSRSFLQESFTKKLDVWNSDDFAIRLPAPLSAVSSVKENGVALVVDKDFSHRSTGLLLRRYESGEPRPWKRGVGMVEVTYTTGDAEAPADVKWATARVVETLLGNITAKRKGPYVQVGDFSIELPTFELLPPEVTRVLAPHRRVSVG